MQQLEVEWIVHTHLRLVILLYYIAFFLSDNTRQIIRFINKQIVDKLIYASTEPTIDNIKDMLL